MEGAAVVGAAVAETPPSPSYESGKTNAVLIRTQDSVMMTRKSMEGAAVVGAAVAETPPSPSFESGKTNAVLIGTQDSVMMTRKSMEGGTAAAAAETAAATVTETTQPERGKIFNLLAPREAKIQPDDTLGDGGGGA